MKIDKRKLTIQILSITGLVLSIKLAMIYYSANYDRYALASFCHINDFVDCDGAAKTNVAQFLGIPLAYWGIFFYITILFLTFVEKLKNVKFLKFLEVFKNPMAYITVLGSIAFLCSMILASISIWGIKKLCLLCLITYFIDLLIAIIPVKQFKDYFIAYKTTFTDFIDGVKKFPKTFVVLLILSISFLTYSALTDNFVPHIKRVKNIKKYANMKTNPYRTDGNVLGVENADVIVIVYSDFVCPMCYINNIMLHKAVSEFHNVEVIHYNLPFDNECNTNIRVAMHRGACFMARAALAAKEQNNYWGMSNLLYEHHPRNVEQLIPLIEELGLNEDKLLEDMNSEKVTKQLNMELNKSYELEINGTPTMFINGEKQVGIVPYYQLKTLLKNHGAK